MSDQRRNNGLRFTSVVACRHGLPATVCLFLVVLLLSTIAVAQTTLSTIRGTATDQSAAVVPGAEITLTEVSTNTTRSTLTDDQGNFELANLKPGIYRLQLQMTGFKTFVADNIILESSQVRRIDPKLEVGEQTTEVTVNASAAVIEKEEAKLSATVQAEQYKDAAIVSLSKFNPNMYIITLPGVQPQQSGFDMNVAGLKGATNFVEGMDGSQNDGTVNQIHNMEDVEEVKVVTINNTADVGRAGYFNLVSKRGNNGFHGSAFYNHTNSALGARPSFAPTKPPQKLHIFGASGSGPIIKDKTFFYASYNGMNDPSKNWILSTVPTEKMRLGDFSETGKVIKDPLTGQPFTGNVIPAARLNQTALKIQDKFFPKPNAPGTTNNFNWFFRYPFDLYRVDYAAVRIDHQLFENNELYGRISNRWTPYVLNGNLPGLDWTRKRYAWQITLNDTHIFTPNFIHALRFGWYKNIAQDGEEVDGFTPLKGNQIVKDLGIVGVNPKGLEAAGFPVMAVTGYPTLRVQPGGYAEHSNEINWNDTVTWTKGRHVWKFGFDLRQLKWLTDTVPQGTFGEFSFDGSLAGYAYADFLLGLPRTSSRLDPINNRTRTNYEAAPYVTDTFKVNERLTLDLGLRWDFFGPGTYEDGLQQNWDPSTGNVIVPQEALARISPLYPVNTIKVVSGDVVPSVDKKNLAPRLGAAFRINDLTVIRGGYGVFTEWISQYPFAYGGGPFQLAESFTNSVVNGQPLFAFPNPFPAGSGNVASQSISGYPVNSTNGYIQQFNLSLERQVKDIGFRVSYIGTRARGLHYNLQLNKPQPSTIPFTQARRPFPQFVGASFMMDDGKTDYNAFMIRANRKVGQVAFDAHWTWANNRSDYLNLENPYNHSLWNRTDMVPNHRVVAMVNWRIPVGRGERALSDSNSVVNAVLGNWRATWMAVFQTGIWFTPSFSGSDPSHTNSFGGVPDRIADGNLDPNQRTISRWFDTSAFKAPADGYYGNSGVNILEGPGRNVHNLSITKEFIFHEPLKMEFGAAIGNLFNHPNFANPAANISALSAGKVSSDVGVWNLENAGARRMEMRLRFEW